MADINIYQDDPDDCNDEASKIGFVNFMKAKTSGDDDGMVNADYENQDAGLSPLEKLEKYMQIDNILSRQMVARALLDTLRAVVGDRDEAEGVLNAVVRLSKDQGASVRSELMEQIPHIAAFCQEHSTVFLNSMSAYLLPIIVQYLTDTNNQVRKTSQAALLVLLEQELVEKDDVEEQICPVVLDLTSSESLDVYRTEAVALLSKMAPLVGKEITERIFLPQFTNLCTDTLFHVRKVCAANFGDICSVVGMSATDEQLLPKFANLCDDGVWGVRKACAECFSAVSFSCSLETRKTHLATLFTRLLCDQSRWVRIAAFEALGPFISTFANPTQTGLYFDDDGVLCYRRPERSQSRVSMASDDTTSIHSPSPPPTAPSPNCDSNYVNNNNEPMPDCTKQLDFSVDSLELAEMVLDSTDVSKIEVNPQSPSKNTEGARDYSTEEKMAETYMTKKASCPNCDDAMSFNWSLQSTPSLSTSSSSVNVSSRPSLDGSIDGALMAPPRVRTLSESSSQSTVGESGNKGHVRIHLDNVGDYNEFQYWRVPLPELDIDLDIVDGKASNIQIRAKVRDVERGKIYASEMTVSVVKDLLGTGDCGGAGGAGAGALAGRDAVFADDDNSTADDTPSVVKPPLINAPLADNSDASYQVHTASVSTVSDVEEVVTHIGSTHILGHVVPETTGTVVAKRDESLRHSASIGDHDLLQLSDLSLQDVNVNESLDGRRDNQDIIPSSLLEHYLSMVDPSSAQTIDTEITRHCAFSFPAVAYTLGREHWPCLRDLYRNLAGDMQWKVRRTLAFSIHELAVILGETITSEDLVPIFNEFLKDLDEVKIGAVKHLADFVRLLSGVVRRSYLYRLSDILSTDNNRNWRYRLELCEQLLLFCDLYSPDDLSHYIMPVALSLAADKVSEVRRCAFRLLTLLLCKLSEHRQDEKLQMSLVNDLIEKFAHSNKWYGRQTFAQLCDHLLDGAYSVDKFAKQFLPSLLNLSDDSIPNVRISLARTLSHNIMDSDYFTSQCNPQHELLLKTLQKLQMDCDRDVRYYATRPSQTKLEDNMTIPV